MSFVKWSDAPKNGLPRALKKVVILGGANVARPKTLITPVGVVTRISGEDLEFLMADPKFQKQIAGGFMSVINDDRDMENVAHDMVKGDKSAPKTSADDFVKPPMLREGDTGKITVGAKEAA